MRTIAIGDIHGCRDSLEALVEYAGVTESDTLVTLGDYVDRGPDSRGVIDFLLEMRTRMRVISLMGNHEVIMLNARESEQSFLSWIFGGVGGRETLASYGGEDLDAIPAAHWDFIEHGERFYQTDTHIFVHAGLVPDVPLEDQADGTLFWKRFFDPKPHLSGKIMVCGHTCQRSGLPRNVGHAICIDTFAWGDGRLTALDVESGRYWQTNERGGRREGEIAARLERG